MLTPPSEGRENSSPPALSPMQEEKIPEQRLNGVSGMPAVTGVSGISPIPGVPVTSGFNLSAVTSHPAYLPHPQFTTLHPALLYQYNTYAMQHQLAHIQQMQLAQLQMSQHKQKRPETRGDGSEESVIKDSNQNR